MIPEKNLVMNFKNKERQRRLLVSSSTKQGSDIQFVSPLFTAAEII